MFKSKTNKFLFGLLIVFIFQNCATNPFTGKSTLALMPNSQILPSSFQQYDQMMEESEVIKNTENSILIDNIGKKIAQASKKWLDANGYKGYLDDYKWEFNLLNDETVNAWAMPGGKVAFYSGILPIAKNQNGIAAIMGHEVAHALANHGQQRMSAGTLQQTAGVAGSLIFNEDQQQQELFMTAYGIGSQIGVMLPFSRKHETEADEIGIKLMAIAGYDPEEASELWKRMAQASGGGTPEFLSTHPSPDSRIENLKRLAPDAKKEAKKFGVTKFQKNQDLNLN
ncbi:MAG: M48 family metallopeptidase [Bacteroidota bacterium]